MHEIRVLRNVNWFCSCCFFDKLSF